ncbi:MAG: hypothetical protein KDK70_06140 [Myxococcales bacterium]|nr:hypothetical protein [Myxococcales bacterium]
MLVLAGSALLTACPTDPPVTPQDTDSDTSEPTADTGGVCTPGQTQPCTCRDGAMGTQACMLSGAGYSTCECDGVDTGTTTVEPTDTGETTTGEDTTTTGPVPCQGPEDCGDLPLRDCQQPACDERGMCVVEPAPFDSPCGDATDDECTNPDTCDNAGNCVPHHELDGTPCTTCGEDQCTCGGGTCTECGSYAPTNNFVTTRSIEGWELTGSWGLHRQAPQSELAPPAEFPGQVLGTNGNRVAPFPGNEVEVSYARTPPTPLPAEIVFLSWNVDEGGGASDNKTIRVSVDGGATWDTLADCAVDPMWPFCQPNQAQNPAVFNLVQIPVPVALQGMLGVVEFGYDTGDACCNFEQGWYIDSLTVATECACSVDADCAAYSTVCGTGICQVNGECGLLPMPEDDPCGDPFDNECNGADGCDGVGYCRDNLQPTGLATCEDCPGGSTCSFCDQGLCLDCVEFTNFAQGFSDPAGMPAWTPGGTSPDWGFYSEAPVNENGVGPTPFPNAPVYGTDGNRQAPYPGAEVETSFVITSPGPVPFELIFGSWNVDEGDFFDTKRIDISVDGGATWTNLVDCQVLPNQPFCNFRDDSRTADDWDVITLDTSPWQGQQGQLRFSHETGDSCCGFERGWYLDFTYALCGDVPFAP